MPNNVYWPRRVSTADGAPFSEEWVQFTAGTTAANAPIFPDANGLATNLYGLGTAGTDWTATEYGFGHLHFTSLASTTATFPAIAGGAALGVGELVYTLPAGAQLVLGAYMTVALTAADGNIDADTPDVGIGTTIASGANALLSAVGAGAENIITGQTATDCSGTATVVTSALAAPVAIEAAGAKTVYLNIADTWAASGETACPVAGTINLVWLSMA